MDETKVRALGMAIQFFSMAPEKTIENVVKGRKREGKIVHLPDLVIEVAEKFKEYID